MKPSPKHRRRSNRARYVLKLYITGLTPHSARAVRNIREICENHFAGMYQLEIVDLYQQPQFTEDEEIIAAPTLLRTRPLPQRRFIGDMSDTAAVVNGLKSA